MRHMLSDSISLGVGLLALYLEKSGRPIIRIYDDFAAVFNGVTLVLIAISMRPGATIHLKSPGMLIIATIGLLVNILVAWILMRGGDTKENLNIRAACDRHLLYRWGHYCGSDLSSSSTAGRRIRWPVRDCCSACIDKWVACDKRCRSCIDGGYP